MKSVGFAGLAAVLSIALAVGCGSDETEDGSGNGPSGGGGEGGEGVGAAGPASSSTGTPASSASSTGAGAAGGEGGAGVGASGGEGGAGVGGAGVGGAGVGGAGVGGAGGDPGGEICNNGTDDDANGDIDCADAACVGTASCTLPAGWTCAQGFFNEAGDGTPLTYYCDCQCGGHDPDCDLPPNNNPLYCSGDVAQAGQACVNDLCTAPTDWTCAAADWDELAQGTANPECNCNCGVADPDCDDAALPIAGCPAGQQCTAEGECDAVPGAWSCDDIWYDEGGNGLQPYCDCSCGAHDPDCDIVPAAELLCSGELPEPGQVCTADVCDAPDAWICDPDYFDEVGQGTAGALCDCECGFPDPDCAVDPPLTVEGCAAGETCNASGTCEDAGVVVPPTWTCNPAYYDDVGQGNSSVFCDCDCGAHDPDCDLPAGSLDGLYCGDDPATAGQMCVNDQCVP